MKILAIMGSPHKGNTYEVLERIEKQLKGYSNVDFEYIHLKDLDIKPCKGCFVCFLRGEEKCPLKDDVRSIASKMDEADGVIFATPVYSMHVSYLLKNFIDRISYNFHRPRYFGKYALNVVVTANMGMKDTLKYLSGLTLCWGFEQTGKLGYWMAPKNTTLRVFKKNKVNTEKEVEKFYRAIKENRKRKLTFIDYIMFHSTRAIFSKSGELSPTDYKYYNDKGWFDKKKKYFFDHIQHNPIKSGIARLMGIMMGRQLEKSLRKSGK
ncbi:MAG: flavodoxin family protein [Acidobacteria bacterium]|nr:flavodoxin family protein [Acidobacteriota bacterium]